METASEIINSLKKKGYSKWKIARILNVSWQTVHMWDRGAFNASSDKLKVLNSLLNKDPVAY